MATGVVTWSKTAASNASADSNQNWAEGMAPSAVNDSARGGMASVAKWRDDLNGTLTSGGTSTAYTVTTNQSFAALAAGLEVTFVANATSGGTATINVDSLGAKPLRSAPGVDLTPGVLIAGTPYRATYFTSNSGEWILHGFYSEPGIPIASSIDYWGVAAPSSCYAFPYGQAISRTTYAALFFLIGTVYGAGDGSTTFNLPDLRGRVTAGRDDMGGSAANRLTSAGSGLDGIALSATGGTESRQLTTANLPPYTPSGSVSTSHNLTVPGAVLGGTNSSNTFGFDGSSFSPATSNQAVSGSVSASFTGAAQGGTSQAFGLVQPTIICNKIIRIL